MKLSVVSCVLFLFGFIEASAKVKTAKHESRIANFHHCVERKNGCGPDIQTERNDHAYKLPYDGGILNDKGEYIPGSFGEVWDHVLEVIAKHLDPKGQEILFRYREHYAAFNTAFLNNDSYGVGQALNKYLALGNEITPFYQDKEYKKACNGGSEYNIRDGIVMIDQSLQTDTDANITLLQKMNDFLKPIANRLYHVSINYKSKSAKSTKSAESIIKC